MFRFLVSRPVVQRFLRALGPLVLYPLLAAFFAWYAVALSSVVCGGLSLSSFKVEAPAFRRAASS